MARTVAFVAEKDLQERVDALVKRMQSQERHGRRYTRSDALRAVVERGLDVLEAEMQSLVAG